MLEQIIKEKISADHLFYVSLKYTKTCDVILNLIKRWTSLMEICFEAMLNQAKKKKKLKAIPIAPRQKTEKLKEMFSKNAEVLEIISLYEFFRQVEGCRKERENEFRKNVNLKVFFKGQEININLEELKQYSNQIEGFVNFVKNFIK